MKKKNNGLTDETLAKMKESKFYQLLAKAPREKVDKPTYFVTKTSPRKNKEEQ